MATGIKAWDDFCSEFGLVSFPAAPSNLVLFVAHSTLLKGRCVDTTRNYLSSIRRFHLQRGVELVTPTEFLPLSDAIKGSRRFLQRPTKKKWPITPGLLAHLLAHFRWGSPWRCLFLFLFVSFARLASVIPAGRRQVFRPAEHLTWKDVSFSNGGVTVKLTRTKTVQMSERYLTFFIPEHEDASVCLVRQLWSWKGISPITSPSDPVFVVADRAGAPVPLTRRLADPVLKATLGRCGATPARYGWSSFRRGGATSFFLASEGKDLETLRCQGDWRSSAYREYLSLPGRARSHVAEMLLRRVSHH